MAKILLKKQNKINEEEKQIDSGVTVSDPNLLSQLSRIETEKYNLEKKYQEDVARLNRKIIDIKNQQLQINKKKLSAAALQQKPSLDNESESH